MCLVSLLDTVGLSKKFFMEQLMYESERDKDLVARKYNIEVFWEHAFFKTKSKSFKNPNEDSDKVIAALEFLSKNIKKDPLLV